MAGDQPSRPTFAPALGDGTRAQAAAQNSGTGGVLMFDPARGRVTAIDVNARSILGWPETETGSGLDAAMPALVRLRDVVRSGILADGPVSEKLLFWSRRGAQRLGCKIRSDRTDSGPLSVRVEIEAPARSLPVSQPEAVVQIVRPSSAELPLSSAEKPASNGHHAVDLPESDYAQPGFDFQTHQIAEPTQSDTSNRVTAPDNTLRNPPEQRDDAATMREIGRRIRNGIRSSAEVAELTAANDRAALPEYLAPTMPPKTVEPNLSAPIGAAEPVEAVAMPSRDSASDAVVASVQLPKAPRTLTEAELQAVLSRTAHEIKTPLSAIAAASEVMRDEHLGPAGSPQYRAYADGINANARHALEIVDRLLKAPLGEADLTREDDSVSVSSVDTIGAAQPSVPRASIQPARPPTVVLPDQATQVVASKPLSPDLNRIVEAVVQDLQPLAAKSDVRLSAVLDPTLRFAIRDATALKQTLINLVTNSLKFTASGGTISVETMRHEETRASLIVRDTGRGMTRATAARLANPELDPGPGRKTPTGHGLGFQQIRAFVADHGADILIESTLGKGTCVSLLLPSET